MIMNVSGQGWGKNVKIGFIRNKNQYGWGTEYKEGENREK